jgi:SAM-dependent methyltransferase
LGGDGAYVTPRFWEFAGRWLPTSPARVLDVGCGAGESTRALAESGYEALGVDPIAPEEASFRRCPLEEFETSEPFDAAIAIRSLHHLDDMRLAIAKLRGALADGAPLVVFEFDVEAVDAPARAWVAERGLSQPIGEEHVHEVIALRVLREGLEERFRLVAEEPAPYLAREAGRPDLEEDELAAIAAGHLRPAGARLAYEAVSD